MVTKTTKLIAVMTAAFAMYSSANALKIDDMKIETNADHIRGAEIVDSVYMNETAKMEAGIKKYQKIRDEVKEYMRELPFFKTLSVSEKSKLYGQIDAILGPIKRKEDRDVFEEYVRIEVERDLPLEVASKLCEYAPVWVFNIKTGETIKDGKNVDEFEQVAFIPSNRWDYRRRFFWGKGSISEFFVEGVRKGITESVTLEGELPDNIKEPLRANRSIEDMRLIGDAVSSCTGIIGKDHPISEVLMLQDASPESIVGLMEGISENSYITRLFICGSELGWTPELARRFAEAINTCPNLTKLQISSESYRNICMFIDSETPLTNITSLSIDSENYGKRFEDATQKRELGEKLGAQMPKLFPNLQEVTFRPIRIRKDSFYDPIDESLKKLGFECAEHEHTSRDFTVTRTYTRPEEK